MNSFSNDPVLIQLKLHRRRPVSVRLHAFGQNKRENVLTLEWIVLIKDFLTSYPPPPGGE